MFLDDYYGFLYEGMGLLLLLLGAVTGLALFRWAGQHHQRVCQRHGTLLAGCGLTGQLAAQRLLALCGLSRVAVLRSRRLNCYFPWKRQIRLNAVTFDSPSLLAVTVAAHEVGHAQQFADGILIARLRSIFWPICFLLIGLAVVTPLLQIAEVIHLPPGSLGWLMLAVGVLVLLLQLPIHLPLEHDATRRARRLVQQARLVGPGEQPAFDAMLKSAWLTHAAHQAQGWVCLLAVAGVFCLSPTFLEPPDLNDQAVVPVANPNHNPVANVAPVERMERTRQRSESNDNQQRLEYAELDALGPVYLLVSGAVGLAPLVLVYLLLGKLAPGSRRKKSAAEEAIARNNAGQVLFEKGALAAAVAAFDEALRLDPTLAPAYFNRGQINVRLGRLDAAMVDFDTNLQLTPGYAYAIAARGDIWALRGDLDRAMTEYDAALCFAPENAALLTRRGQAWLSRNDHDQAIADFTAALDRHPRQAAAWRDRGLARYHKNEFASAIADQNEAIRLNPADAVAFNNRGAAHLKAGDYAQSATDLREAIRLDPKFPNPRKHLAWLQATCPEPALRDGPAAVANATRALELTGGKPIEWFAVLAAAHAEAGNFDEAVKWQTKCRDESPPEARDELQVRLELYQSREAFREP